MYLLPWLTLHFDGPAVVGVLPCPLFLLLRSLHTSIPLLHTLIIRTHLMNSTAVHIFVSDSKIGIKQPWSLNRELFSSLIYFEKSLIYNIIQRLRIVTLIDIMKLNVLDDCKDYRNSQSHYIRLSRDCGPAASAPPLTLSRFFVDVGHAIKLVVQTQSACFWE